MSAVSFIKAHHLGNDYVYINLVGEQGGANAIALKQYMEDSLTHQEYSTELKKKAKKVFLHNNLHPNVSRLRKFVKETSSRKFGVGSDGVVFICEYTSSSSASSVATVASGGGDSNKNKTLVQMLMYNSDGSHSLMCGNALMTIALIVTKDILLAPPPRKEEKHEQEKAEEEEEQSVFEFGIQVGSTSAPVVVSKKPNTEKTFQVKVGISVPIFEKERIPVSVVSSQPEALPFDSSLILSATCCSSPSDRPFRFFFNIDSKNSNNGGKNKEVVSFLQQNGLLTPSSLAFISSNSANSITSSSSSESSSSSSESSSPPFVLLCSAISMGNPHAIVLFEKNINSNNNNEDEEAAEVAKLLSQFPLAHFAENILLKNQPPGQEKEEEEGGGGGGKHVEFLDGANVSVGVIFRYEQQKEEEEKKEKGDGASVVSFSVCTRTFERGAGETLACGSGACALVVAAAHLFKKGEQKEEREEKTEEKKKNKKRIFKAQVFPVGGKMKIEYVVDEDGKSKEPVEMEGEPKIICRGELEEIEAKRK